MKQLKNLIKEATLNTGVFSIRRARTLANNVDDLLKEATPGLRIDASFNERAYWIMNSLTDYPNNCANCNMPLTLFKNGYKTKYCSTSCRSSMNAKGSKNNFYGTEGIKRRKDGMRRHYGVEHNYHLSETVNKRRKTCNERFGGNSPQSSHVVRANTRRSQEDKGKWLPKSKYQAFDLYCIEVRKITERQDLTTLENHDKRGITNFHLDHKVSKYEGFVQNIPPFIIGNIMNLHFIPYKENIRKRTGSLLTPLELVEKFYD